MPDAEIVPRDAFERAKALSDCLRERTEWGRRYHIGYARGWDIRAMNMIRAEVRRINVRLHEEFGYNF
jgi:hypothetical protein